jgi:hypothetical protein
MFSRYNQQHEMREQQAREDEEAERRREEQIQLAIRRKEEEEAQRKVLLRGAYVVFLDNLSFFLLTYSLTLGLHFALH